MLLGTCWEPSRNLIGTHWENSPSPPSRKKKKTGPLSACGLTSLLRRIFMPTSSVLYQFLAEANGISMNSGLHKILITINYIMSTTSIIRVFSGGRPEGSKRNLKFQRATWDSSIGPGGSRMVALYCIFQS